jgi:hypothetical protein
MGLGLCDGKASRNIGCYNVYFYSYCFLIQGVSKRALQI